MKRVLERVIELGVNAAYKNPRNTVIMGVVI